MWLWASCAGLILVLSVGGVQMLPFVLLYHSNDGQNVDITNQPSGTAAARDVWYAT
jgi:hypothetical protein